MYLNSLKILLLSAVIALSFSSSVDALTKARKIDACLSGLLSDEDAASLIDEMVEWKSIYKRSLRANSALCFTKLTGYTAEFINDEGLVVDQAGLKFIEERRRKIKEASQLKTKITNVEKQLSCVLVKATQTSNQVNAIIKRFEKINQSLVLNDTHEACTKLYSSSKSSAMLTQTCVDAFDRLGHPDLVILENDKRASASAELSLSLIHI